MKHAEGAAEPTATIAARVRELRRRLGWTAEKLGARMAELGVEWDRSIVANFENGRRRTVSVVEWLCLARALEVSPLHLLIQPEGPGRDRRPYQVTPNSEASKEDARAWIRGMSSLPGTDLRIFYSEVPAEEWGHLWILLQQGADPDGRVGELHKWARRGYGGYGDPWLVGEGGDDGEHR